MTARGVQAGTGCARVAGLGRISDFRLASADWLIRIYAFASGRPVPRGCARPGSNYILDSLRMFRDRDTKVHGDFRTKRVIGEMYDEMAKSIATKSPYVTVLYSPPADPRVAHPARARASSSS